MKIVVCTGGFDPLHSGHIKYLQAARQLGDKLLIGLNSDNWLSRKKGRAFMPFEERISILRELKSVDYVFSFDDNDNSACDAIYKTQAMYPDNKIIFANGGDRTADNIPEMKILDVEFVFGVGGEDKANSSSWILQEWKAPKTERSWGYYRVLHEVPGMKVKELTINPGSSISYQKHTYRSEFWMVAEGTAEVIINNPDENFVSYRTLDKYQELTVNRGYWHKMHNTGTTPLRIVEIQFGDYCEEEDIERKEFRTGGRAV